MSGITRLEQFESPGQMVNVLLRNPALNDFARKLFKRVSDTNASGRSEREVQRKWMFCDSVAQILTGDEVCAAVAFSGNDILIATNKSEHDRRVVRWFLTTRIIEADPLRLQILCTVELPDREPVIQEGEILDYRRNGNTIEVVGGNQELHFHFDDLLPDGPIDIRAYTRSTEFPFYNFPPESEFPFTSPVVTSTGTLQRRAGKLFSLLSMIANAVLTRRAWLKAQVKSSVRGYVGYIEEQYRDFLSKEHETCDYLCAERFLDFIRDECAHALNLNQPGGNTKEDFLQAAKENFNALHLCDMTSDMLKFHRQWIGILSDSLTFELTKTFPEAKDKINEMANLYEAMIESYRAFSPDSSPEAILAWFATIDKSSFAYPPFLLTNFEVFHKTARRLFYQLAFMEEFIHDDAKRGGALSIRLSKETIFKAPGIRIIDGGEAEVHAEMRLISEHLLLRRDISDYVGIAKLCCALCHHALKQVSASGIRAPKTRGTHATIYKWPIPRAFEEDRHLKVLLRSLYSEYAKLPRRQRLFSKKKGPFYDHQQVAKMCIVHLDKLNSRKPLKELGINPQYLIDGSKEHYPKLNKKKKRVYRKLRAAAGQNENAQPLVTLAKHCQEDGRWQESFDHLTRALERGEESHQLFKLLGDFYSHVGDTLQAQDFYDQARAIARESRGR